MPVSHDHLTGPWCRQLPTLCVLTLYNRLLLGLDLVYGHNRSQEGETEIRERAACKDELPAVLHVTNTLPATSLSAFLPSALWENEMGSQEEKSQKATYAKVNGDKAASKMMGEEAVLPASTSVQNPVSTMQPCFCRRKNSRSRRMSTWAASEISWWEASLIAPCPAGKLEAVRRQGHGGTCTGVSKPLRTQLQLSTELTGNRC